MFLNLYEITKYVEYLFQERDFNFIYFHIYNKKATYRIMKANRTEQSVRFSFT